MAITLTSTAYSATPKQQVAGMFSINFNYTSPAGTTFCASANATTILGPRIQQGTTINDIMVYVSSGSATNPTDVGIEASLSKFASQVASGNRTLCGKATLPYKISVSDDAANLWKTVKYSVTPGTNTAVVKVKSTIICTRDPD